MIKFILFDLDGTLTDPKEGITKSVSYSLKHFGIDREPGELTEFIGPPLKEQFMSYASLSDEEAVRAVEIYRERFAPKGIFENKIYDGIIPMMDKLVKNGKTLALATSKPYVYAEKIVEKYKIKPYLSLVCGSELDGRNTNKADVIRLAMKKLGAKSDNTVMVGDRKHDAEGAEKNSIKFIGVSYGYANEGELEKCCGIGIAKNPIELENILISL